MASYPVLSSRQYFQVLVSPSHVASVVLACCWGELTSPSDTGFSYLRALPIGAIPGVSFPHLCQYGVRLLSLPPPCDRGGPLIQFGPVATVFPWVCFTFPLRGGLVSPGVIVVSGGLI